MTHSFPRVACLATVVLLGATTYTAGQAPDSSDAVTASKTDDKSAEESGTDQASPTPEEKARELFKEGRAALYQSKFATAIDALSQAIKLDPGKTSYRVNLARALRYANRTDEAAKHLEEILKASPDHVEAGQMLGEIYTAKQDWKAVVRVLKPLLKYRHDYPTYHMLAEAQYNLGELGDARKNYEVAVKLNPASAADHYQLGNLFLTENLFALAAESYEQALNLGLDSPVLRYKLGSAYFNLRNYFGQISVQSVKSGEIDTISGTWYLIEPLPGKKEVFRCAPEKSAIYQIARAVADGIEDRPDLQVLRATIYLNGHRYEKAREMFAKIGPAVPKEDKALFFFYYAQAAFGCGDYDRYLELLQEAIKLDKPAYEATLVDAYLEVADRYNQSGDLEKYIEYLAKAVGENPQNAALHLDLGNAFEEAEKFEQAIIQWRMVLDIEPDHSQRLRLLNTIKKYQAGLALKVSGDASDETPKDEPKDPNPESR